MNHMPEDLPASFEDIFDNIEFPAELFDFLSDIVSEPETPVVDHPQTTSQKQGNNINFFLMHVAFRFNETTHTIR